VGLGEERGIALLHPVYGPKTVERERLNLMLDEGEDVYGGGHGYATVRIPGSGSVRVAGRLPDGRNFSGRARMVNQGEDRPRVLIHTLKLKKSSFLLGQTAIQAAPDSSVEGETLFWAPDAFRVAELWVDGSRWVAPAAGAPWREGSFDALFRLAPPWVENAPLVSYTTEWPANNKPEFSDREAMREPVRFKVNWKTGLFRGSLRPDQTVRGQSFSGLFLTQPLPLAEPNEGQELHGAGYMMVRWADGAGIARRYPTRVEVISSP
jgi:hypothetical protein